MNYFWPLSPSLIKRWGKQAMITPLAITIKYNKWHFTKIKIYACFSFCCCILQFVTLNTEKLSDRLKLVKSGPQMTI